MLFGKLQQGVVENQQILTIAKMRAEAEELYGRRLGDITPTTDKLSNGFARDDGASLRKVCILFSKTHILSEHLHYELIRPTKVSAVKWKRLRRTIRKLLRISAN